jgi:1-phosphofructokinase family hexose kinase
MSIMIVAVTPNAAVDRTLVVPGYGRGGVFRTTEQVIAAGGKGINVARAAVVLGAQAVCAGFIAGHSGRLLTDLLRREGLPARWTALDPEDGRETRTCVILVDPASHQVTVVNEHGPAVTADDWARLTVEVTDLAGGASAVTLSGSLPPGSPLDAYAALIGSITASGTPIWVDASGAALQAALLPGVRIKVNYDEAAVALGLSIPDSLEAVVQAAHAIQRITNEGVVITRGAAGALYYTGQKAWLATPPAIKATSAVGSGDSFLAGLLVALERGDSASDALRLAVGAGAANALSLGGGRFDAGEALRLAERTQVVTL